MNRAAKHSVGQVIRFFREREGLTQEELADIIHVTKGKLAHWEDDVTIPRPTMVARLQGALRISDADMLLLLNAVKAAEDKRTQEQAALQAIADEQSAEDKRLFHRSKAIQLVLMGLGGFAAGFVFMFLIGSTKDFPWYAPFVIGLCLSGVPFGWNLIRDKSDLRTRTIYYGPDGMLVQFMAGLIGFALKFMIAYVIGLLIFPIALLYHAYNAGQPGSLYKSIIRILLSCYIQMTPSRSYLSTWIKSKVYTKPKGAMIFSLLLFLYLFVILTLPFWNCAKGETIS